MKYNYELAILPLLSDIKVLPIDPIANYKCLIDIDGLSIEIELDTYYPSNRTSISIKHKDIYMVSRASLKYFVNYALLDNRIEGCLFIAPSIIPAKSEINYSDFGTNIKLMYGIMES